MTQETLDLASRYLRVLAAVERAHALGDVEDLVALLSGVDPSDLAALIRTLESGQLSFVVAA